MGGLIALTLITKRKYVNRQTIEVNGLKFQVVITGYVWLFIFHKSTKVDIISSNVTLNINL